MIWIAPSGKDAGYAALEKRLGDAADQFRANSGLKSQEYSVPVLSLIFLSFAEVGFAARRGSRPSGGRFYTPNSIIRLLTKVIDPYHGCILDPAHGSDGMAVSSARFMVQTFG